MNETKPLLNKNESGGSCGNGDIERDAKTWLRLGLEAISLIGIGVLIGGSWNRPSTITSPEPLADVPPPNSRNRRFCRIYGDRVKFAGILETSIGNPSQQWSHIPCYAQPKKSNTLLWASQDSDAKAADINGYGAPDAIFRTDFRRPAFPNRQPIVGFGAAFTEAASLNYQSLSVEGKARLMELLYGKTGIGYSIGAYSSSNVGSCLHTKNEIVVDLTMVFSMLYLPIGRVPLNSCDFSIESYSFDEVNDDFDLKHFDNKVTHDAQKDGMIDMILRATKVFNDAWRENIEETGENFEGVKDGDFKMFASPWSPPSWMKAPSSWEDRDAGLEHASGMTGSAQPSCLREGTGKESRYAKAWALYMSKFVSAYRDYGVPLEAVTVQNEPEFPAPWEACSYTPKTQADFIAYHLGPQLGKDHPDVKIFMFDHNKVRHSFDRV